MPSEETTPSNIMGESQHEETDEVRRTGAIHAVLSFVIALGLLVLGVVAIILFVISKPEAEKKDEEKSIPTVLVRPLVTGSHDVTILTQGVVRSVREVSIAAEIGGRVEWISDELIGGGLVEGPLEMTEAEMTERVRKEGGSPDWFYKSEADGEDKWLRSQVLVRIDSADYKAALARAEAGLADAQLVLAQEEALAEQADLDWKKLGRGAAGPLVLREPQIAAAKARIGSARAEVAKAKRDEERTSILVPFAARVRKAHVEEGAVVAPGTPVAELYSSSELEVRLPFPLEDFGYLDPGASPEVQLRASIGGREKTWRAVMDRLEGEVERSTLSGFGIARVLPDDDGELPPVGLFVNAEVPGETLEDVVELPRSAVRGADEVWVVSEGLLVKRQVRILRAKRQVLVVQGDFSEEDQLVLTRLAAPMVGTAVEVELEDEADSSESGEGGAAAN